MLTFFVGRPLIDAAERKNAAEAQSRYELVRVRENAESIALIGGADDEREKFRGTLNVVLERWRHVIRQNMLILLIVQGNTMLSPVLPLLIASPKYLSGELSLGQLMQISAAFLQVQVAFNWLGENLARVADWSAPRGAWWNSLQPCAVSRRLTPRLGRRGERGQKPSAPRERHAEKADPRRAAPGRELELRHARSDEQTIRALSASPCRHP